MYSIFRVYDYKGGELSSSINIDESRFIGKLADLFENGFDGLVDEPDFSRMNLKDIEDALKKIEKSNEFYSEYAGGYGFVGEIYEHSNNKLVSKSIKQFIPQIAKHIKENWN